MGHEWLSFPRETSKSGLFQLQYSTLFPAFSWIFLLDSTTNKCPKWVYHIFPSSSFNFPHHWRHLQIFRWPGQPVELSVSLNSISSSPHHLWIYIFISIATIILHCSWFPESVPPTFGCQLMFLNTILSWPFFSESSSDPLCVMNQAQIFYLGIPRLSFSL